MDDNRKIYIVGPNRYIDLSKRELGTIQNPDNIPLKIGWQRVKYLPKSIKFIPSITSDDIKFTHYVYDDESPTYTYDEHSIPAFNALIKLWKNENLPISYVKNYLKHMMDYADWEDYSPNGSSHRMMWNDLRARVKIPSKAKPKRKPIKKVVKKCKCK
jgi:hypothetical protein